MPVRPFEAADLWRIEPPFTVLAALPDVIPGAMAWTLEDDVGRVMAIGGVQQIDGRFEVVLHVAPWARKRHPVKVGRAILRTVSEMQASDDPLPSPIVAHVAEGVEGSDRLLAALEFKPVGIVEQYRHATGRHVRYER